jgi:CheY-like chemotaxis protein
MSDPLPSVLICEDAPGYQLLTQTVLEDAGFSVAGVAATWGEALELAESAQPDVILLDLWLPTFERDSVTAVRVAAPRALLTVVSALAVDDSQALLEGLQGIDLVLSKRDPPETLVNAVRERLPQRATDS